MKALVVTADDFGSALEVNEAVEIAYRDGILTAASLMVSAPAARDAVERARRLPELGVGLHLVLVDGRPTLPADRVPDLVDRNGRFRNDMAVVGLRIAMWPSVRKQLHAEIDAQFAAFAATGLPFDHVNAHKHFHLHPVIGRMVMETAALYAVTAIRAPIEPRSAATSGWLVSPFARLLALSAKRHGFITPDHVHGISHSGHMTGERIRQTIASMPDGLNEIYLHPAVRDDYAGHGPGYAHRAEFEGLIAEQSCASIETHAVRSGSFSSLLEGPH
ncbi:MAG: hopanoid biosynthesis-associated protein HpnK [Burkholderiaceae bacterium]